MCALNRRQFPRLEPTCAGACHHLVQAESRGTEQLPRHIELYPRRRLELRIPVVAQVHLFTAPGIAHHPPAVAREIGTMNDQNSDRTLARRFLELVRPASVIGHSLRVEEFWILRRRLVDDHQQHLALDVHALEIVPAIFGRLDAVADENDGRIDIGAVRLSLVAGHVILAQFQVDGLSMLRLQGEARRGQCPHTGEFDLLHISAVVPRRSQSIQRKLRGDVLRRDVAAARTGAPPLEEIVRQEPHMRADAFRVDAPHRGGHIDGQPQVRCRV